MNELHMRLEFALTVALAQSIQCITEYASQRRTRFNFWGALFLAQPFYSGFRLQEY